MYPGALYVLLGAALAISLVSDLRFRRIYDVVTWPAILGALALRWWAEGVGDWDQGLASGLLGAAAAAVVFGGVALVSRGVGWGDVKLLVAVGSAVGVPLVLTVMIAISVVGAIQAIVIVLWQSRAREGQTNSGALGRHIPYGVAIALGTAWAVWSSARN
jgi:prepilin peptidase CpaA